MNLIEFKDKPDTTTPINKTNLNHNFNEVKKMVKTTETISDEDTYCCNYINNITPKIKRFNQFLKAGNTLTDSDILKTKSIVIIHYSVHASGYLKSAVIQVGNGTWYWDYAIQYDNVIYFRIDWQKGTIEVSSSSTNSDAVGIVGYDILM